VAGTSPRCPGVQITNLGISRSICIGSSTPTWTSTGPSASIRTWPSTTERRAATNGGWEVSSIRPFPIPLRPIGRSRRSANLSMSLTMTTPRLCPTRICWPVNGATSRSVPVDFVIDPANTSSYQTGSQSNVGEVVLPTRRHGSRRGGGQFGRRGSGSGAPGAGVVRAEQHLVRTRGANRAARWFEPAFALVMTTWPP